MLFIFAHNDTRVCVRMRGAPIVSILFPGPGAHSADVRTVGWACVCHRFGPRGPPRRASLCRQQHLEALKKKGGGLSLGPGRRGLRVHGTCVLFVARARTHTHTHLSTVEVGTVTGTVPVVPTSATPNGSN